MRSVKRKSKPAKYAFQDFLCFTRKNAKDRHSSHRLFMPPQAACLEETIYQSSIADRPAI